MKISRMSLLKNDNGGKTAAYFDLQTDDEIIIKGFRVVNGPKGLFISSPSEKGKDGKYYDNVIIPDQLKRKVETMALEEYEKSKRQ